MTIDSDFHSHICPSSAHEMVGAAQKKGLNVLGISEHVFQMREAHPLLEHMPQEGPLLTFTSYTTQVRTTAQQLQYDVRLGLEVDFIPGKNEYIQELLQGHEWDFLIGSVHEINGKIFEVDQNWSQEQGEPLWLRYFELLRAAVSSGYFSLVSHPVRMNVSNPHLPPNFDEELERLAGEAALHDVALEMNGFDVLTSPSLVRRLAKACALQHTPISVGSDAHDPEGVARAHQQTEVILREAGITRIRTWKQCVAEEYSIRPEE